MSATVSEPPARAVPQGFAPARITARRALAPRIEQFELRLDAAPDAPPAPGSHLELLLPVGAAGELEVRHYSVCGSEGARVTIAVLREAQGRGGSRWLHEHGVPGAEIAVRGPRSTFPFRAGRGALFVAGGIGITPFLTMVPEAERRGVEWRLLYLGRRSAGMAFTEELSAYGDRVDLWPSEERGRADLAAVLASQPAGVVVHACGPEPLQRALRELVAGSGHELVIEDFASGREGPAGSSGELTANDRRPALPFTVELADGTEVEVPAERSILEALNEAGIRVLSSCRRGTCGTCETPIIEGTADHRDSVLSDEERAANETMMICVSRACGDRIVLDL